MTVESGFILHTSSSIISHEERPFRSCDTWNELLCEGVRGVIHHTDNFDWSRLRPSKHSAEEFKRRICSVCEEPASASILKLFTCDSSSGCKCFLINTGGHRGRQWANSLQSQLETPVGNVWQGQSRSSVSIPQSWDVVEWTAQHQISECLIGRLYRTGNATLC